MIFSMISTGVFLFFSFGYLLQRIVAKQQSQLIFKIIFSILDHKKEELLQAAID